MADKLNGKPRQLTRDAILYVDDLPRIELEIPEWDGRIYIRTMTGGERDRFEAEWRQNSTQDIRARLAVATICNDQGELLFGPDDVPAITKKSSKALDRIFAAAAKHSGITDQDVEALRKNS